VNARFVPSEYSGNPVASALFSAVWDYPVLTDIVAGGVLTFAVHPLILKPVLPSATYSQRAVVGLGLLVTEALILRHMSKRKST
jgi:hypothetical protein